MKKVLLAALLAIAIGWYFVGGRSLTPNEVADFYRKFEAAELERKPESICALLSNDFKSVGTTTVGGRSEPQVQTQDKAEACASYQKLYETWEILGQKMGGVLQLDSHYEIHSVSISRDGKTATVDISASLDVAGSIMNIRSRSTDTLIRKNGAVLMARTEGTGSITSGR